MEHLSEDHPNQHKNSHNLWDEIRHSVLSLLENKNKKLYAIVEQILASEERKKSKRAGL